MNRAVLCLVALLSSGCSEEHRESERDAGASPAPDAGTPDPDAICSTCGACEETRTGLSFAHTSEPVSYNESPPVGGDHAGCWAPFGVHEDEVPEGRWVHNLEHGAVVFLHNCGSGCEDEIAQLEALAEGRPFALVTKNTRLPTRFAVVAWGVKLLTDCVDEEAFARFYDAHEDRARESSTAPPPSGC